MPPSGMANRLVGVGFAAQGFERSTYFRRRPEADDPRAAFIMEGVPDEIIGDFGTANGHNAVRIREVVTNEPPNANPLGESDV